VQTFAPVDHREERDELRARLVGVGDELPELVERAQRQGGRDQGHQQGVGGVQHVLRRQRDARWAVQEDDVVVVRQAVEQPTQTPRPLLAVVEVEIQVAVAEVRGQQVQVGELGRLHGVLQRVFPGHQPPTAALDPRAHLEDVRRRSLRIQVPQQRPVPVPRAQMSQVHRGGRLPHAALDGVGRDDLHRTPPPLAALSRLPSSAIILGIGPDRRPAGTCMRTLR